MPFDTSGPQWTAPLTAPLNLTNWTKTAAINLIAAMAGLDPSLQIGFQDIPPGAYDAVNSTEDLLTPGGGVTLVYAPGATLAGIYSDVLVGSAPTLTVAVDGHNIPGSDTWQILHSGTVIATDSVPADWNVVFASGVNYTITVPGGTPSSSGSAYEFRIVPSYSFTGGGGSVPIADSGHFDVP